MTEKVIEEYLRDQIKALGGKAYKFVSPGNIGVPDRLVCFRGKVVFVELKAPGKKPTALQLKKHKELKKLGQEVYVMDSKAKVDALVESFRAVFCREVMPR